MSPGSVEAIMEGLRDAAAAGIGPRRVDVDAARALQGALRTGVVGFSADRCALKNRQEASRFAGPEHYSRLEDGRWTLSRGTVGSWWGFDPRLLLEGVLQASSGVPEVEAGRFQVEFDIERLGPLMNPGLHQAGARLGSDR